MGTPRRSIGSGRAAWLLVGLGVLGAAGCGGSGGAIDVPELGDGAPTAGGNAGGAPDAPPGDFPDAIDFTTLVVTGVEPASGPFTGGNRAVVRGSGFTDRAVAYVGGRSVQPVDTVRLDANSLSIVVPAGEVGPADVSVEVDEQTATRDDAYTYNALRLDPTEGSVAGGTSIAITITDHTFDENTVIEFGGTACSGLEIVTPREARCKAPAGTIGSVDVVAKWPDAGKEPVVAVGAYQYLDLTDTARGGFGGGPIDGTINVTVVDSEMGFVVEGAYVLVGEDLDTALQGFTNERGQITLSEQGLTGPVDVHVAAECFERASFVGFDRSDVTVFLRPLLDPSCGEPGASPSSGRAAAGSVISGELIFPGSDEFAINAWDVVPPPRADELRVAYVYTTQSRLDRPNPNPDVGGAIARIVESGAERGLLGYPYRIFARPAGLAVYALSGLERTTTGEFTPYVMGVARNVITAPGEETAGIDIVMNLPLDRELEVELTTIPEGTARGPDEFRVQAHVDLGGEGVIVRNVRGQTFDVKTSFTAGAPFRFFAQPPLSGILADARHLVVAGWYLLDGDDVPPYTEVRRRGVAQGTEAERIDDLLDFPQALAPADGETLPADRVLRWSVDGPSPDLFVISIVGGDGFPAWTQIVPGSLRESPLPDLSTIEGIGDIAGGFLPWTLRAVKMEGFDYGAFHYGFLSDRSWSHTAIDQFTMRL